MKVKMLALRWTAGAASFEGAPLAAFFADHAALEVIEHFLADERTLVLVLVIRYRDEANGPANARERRKSRTRPRR